MFKLHIELAIQLKFKSEKTKNLFKIWLIKLFSGIDKSSNIL